VVVGGGVVTGAVLGGAVLGGAVLGAGWVGGAVGWVTGSLGAELEGVGLVGEASVLTCGCGEKVAGLPDGEVRAVTAGPVCCGPAATAPPPFSIKTTDTPAAMTTSVPATAATPVRKLISSSQELTLSRRRADLPFPALVAERSPSFTKRDDTELCAI
jgi:hypothetical protein